MKKRDVSLDDVNKFVLDKALEESEFCSVKNVADELGISKDKSRDFLNSLVEDGRLAIVYENPQIKVYAPREIIRQIIRQIARPEWLPKYPLPNKEKHMETKAKLDRALREYDRFEELLYLKHKILEEPAMFTFKWLGFKVEKLPEGEFADFKISKDGFSGAVEVSGGNAGCPLGEVRQLFDYFWKMLEKEKRPVKNLILLFNHFCDTDLEERAKKQPFAKEIREGAKRSGITLATTAQLYEKIRRVKSGKVTKEQVAKEIIEGKWD
jgi:hypothetical protein